MNIFEFAINMELEGNKYYTQQAKANEGNELFEVFMKLANDEKKHAELIGEMKDGKKYSAAKVKKSEAQNVFSDKEKSISEIKVTPEQLDVYRFALDKEKESIELYTELMEKSDNESAAYQFLIAEETKHFEIVSTLVKLLENSKQWVESAEFGTRKDY